MLLTLQSEGCSAVINSVGAELKSFKNKEGKEFLWTSDPTYWNKSSPLLFPSIGNVREGRTFFQEKEYAMPKHGFCIEEDFTIIEHTKTTATFSYASNATTLAVYPYAFRITLAYELKDASIFMTYHVYNEDTQVMPYHLGAHPGFLCPMEPEHSFSDYVLQFEYPETCISPVYDLEKRCFSAFKTKQHLQDSDTIALSYDKFDDDAIVFSHMKSRSVKILHAATQKGVQVDYPDFATVAFWTPDHKEAPFLCVEPWNGSAIYEDEDDVFAHKRDIQVLAVGESKQYHLALHLLD